MPTKYAPLAAYLAAQPPETTTVTLTAPEVEELIGAPLPAAAATATWWGNLRDRAPAAAWLAVGWRQTSVRVRQVPVVVTFARVDRTAPPPAPA